MAPKGSCNGNGKGTARTKMPKSVIFGRLPLAWYSIKGFIPEHNRGLIRIYIDCGITVEMAWDRVYDIIFLNPVTTRH